MWKYMIFSENTNCDFARPDKRTKFWGIHGDGIIFAKNMFYKYLLTDVAVNSPKHAKISEAKIGESEKMWLKKKWEKI